MSVMIMFLIMIILSVLSFVWLTTLLSYLMTKDLKMEDVYEKESYL